MWDEHACHFQTMNQNIIMIIRSFIYSFIYFMDEFELSLGLNQQF